MSSTSKSYRKRQMRVSLLTKVLRTHSQVVAKSAYLAIALLSGLGMLGKLNLLRLAFHTPARITWLLLGAGLLAPLLWRVTFRFKLIVAPLILVGLATVVLFAYPQVKTLHGIGRGSDQADCVIVAGHQLLTGHWPYQRDRLWSHNPMSCGPGWIALQAPVIETWGYQANILVVWLCSLGGLILCVGWEGTSGIVALLFLSSGAWLALANGTDFLSFGISIATLTMMCEYFEKEPTPLILLTALVVQFRFPVIFLPMFMKRGKFRVTGIFISIFAAACFAVFLLWKPGQMVADGPLFLLHKLTSLPWLTSHPTANLVALAALFSCGLIVCILLSRSFAGPWTVLFYMLILFGVPAVVNLALTIRQGPTLVIALGHWEGGMWLIACLPLASALVVRESRLVSHEAPGSVAINHQPSQRCSPRHDQLPN